LLAVAFAVLATAKFLLKNRAPKTRIGLRISGTLLGTAAAFLLGYGAWLVSGTDSAMSRTVLPGVTYERFRVGDAVAHLVSIDLNQDCAVLATSEVAADGTANASKTISWAESSDLSVAINGGFFYPYDQSTAWDVYPAEGETVTVLGPVVRPAGGVLDHHLDVTNAPAPRRSQSTTAWDGASFWINSDGRARIGELPDGAALAVTGRHQILSDGVVVAPASEPYPRTIVSVDDTGRRMWWLVVDGKQPGYSLGLPLADAAELLAERGAVDAVELDGGGSSTLVLKEDSGHRVASRPMEVRVPGRSRVVANHLGIAAVQTDVCSSDAASADS
jgi:hypothetical protein